MSTNAIIQWLSGHFGMKESRDYYDRGNKTFHRVQWENGDSYEHEEIYQDRDHKRTITRINGHIVADKNLEWIPYKWAAI